MSPEFRLRPSLSVVIGDGYNGIRGRVAGVQTPAFVERVSGSSVPSIGGAVSPEFRLRPSLSGRVGDQIRSTWVLCRRSSDSGLR